MNAAIDYFDRLTLGGQFSGSPALAVGVVASRFGLDREALRAAILARREAEERAFLAHAARCASEARASDCPGLAAALDAYGRPA